MSRGFRDLDYSKVGFTAEPACGFINVKACDKFLLSSDGPADGMAAIGDSPDTNSTNAVQKLGGIWLHSTNKMEALQEIKETANLWWALDEGNQYRDDYGVILVDIPDNVYEQAPQTLHRQRSRHGSFGGDAADDPLAAMFGRVVRVKRCLLLLSSASFCYQLLFVLWCHWSLARA